MRIVVTGGTGKGGGWVVRDLLDHGHEVRNVDVRPGGSSGGQTLVTDLTDLGQAQDALSGYDAVVHFAAIPAPGLRPEGETFRNNALSTYNVFQAAAAAPTIIFWASLINLEFAAAFILSIETLDCRIPFRHIAHRYEPKPARLAGFAISEEFGFRNSAERLKEFPQCAFCHGEGNISNVKLHVDK
jgi:nucleoside-diphosphate-sugar epimerase